MEQRLDRIESKLDKVVETQAEIQANLQEHMRRTEIAETNIDKLANAIKPIQEHVAMVKGTGILIIAISTIGGAIAAFLQIFLGGK